MEAVRIAFEGDSVLFSPESDELYKAKGLDAFLRHETENAINPMNDGSFAKFIRKLFRAVSDQMESLCDSMPMKLLDFQHESEFAKGESALGHELINE